MKLRNIIVVVVLLCVMAVWLSDPWAAAGMMDESNVEREIIETVHAQTEAVNKGDWEQFKKHLWKNDPTYVKERKRWFSDAVRTADPDTFQMSVDSITKHEPSLWQVWIHQSYQHEGINHDARFPLIYKQTKDGWKDADVMFHEISRGNVIVKFTDKLLSKQANAALNVAERALFAFEDRLGRLPGKRIQIKLYDQHEVFRQSVKLSLPNWAAGWNERGQAIKFVGSMNRNDLDHTFVSGIIHELSHRVISDLSNDNAAYWLQEGLAEYYQRHLLPDFHQQDRERIEKPQWTFDQLEQLQLETLPAEQARQYYLHSYDIVRLYMMRYGEKELIKWCEALRVYPLIDQESTEKLHQLNERTRKAFEKATNQSFKSFAHSWSSKNERLK